MQNQPSQAALCTAWEDWLWYFLLYNSFQLETVAALVVGSGPEVRKETTIKNRMKKFKSGMAFVFYEWKCRTFWLQQATHTMQECSSCQALLDMHPDFDRRKTLEELTVLWFVMLKQSHTKDLSDWQPQQTEAKRFVSILENEVQWINYQLFCCCCCVPPDVLKNITGVVISDFQVSLEALWCKPKFTSCQAEACLVEVSSR